MDEISTVLRSRVCLQERTVVVREVDGTLRTANVEEQYRMNRIFYQRPARPVNPPAVFADPHLQVALLSQRML